MMRLLHRAGALGLLAALLSGCAIHPWPPLAPSTPAGETVIDAGFRNWEAKVPSEDKSESEKVHATAYLKLADIGGKLGLCGAYVYDGEKDLFASIPLYFTSRDSYLAIRGDGGSLTYLRTDSLADDDLHFDHGLRPGALPAHCVVTDLAWQESYAEAPIELHLHPPPPLPGQNSAPVGVVWVPVFIPRR